ncbi:MAG: hypothetical protein KGM60_00965 [Comamonadaceae bacterium]|nr:hypothetical protein [Comamonadaceae bacterium]
MRRLFFILLLLCLPLQSVWAAAAGYCSHEASPAAVHFGHHQHLDHDEHGAGQASKVGADMDCHTCHGLGNALHAAPAAVALRLTAVRPAPFVLPLLRAPAPLRPERPNWSVLA